MEVSYVEKGVVDGGASSSPVYLDVIMSLRGEKVLAEHSQNIPNQSLLFPKKETKQEP